ncbi:MAG: universal stress protein [Tissierellia bacterium]|jgi:nucleotide-binding universal stress UspA family protein|nr:universal stress protein [Sedimentibacter sp.]NLA13790.1 universal stress protein [Tissierellia bacterium]HOA19942.1 universal stress protein [Sedimentibacter sp.]HOG62967.1 universal stress protein [Sedimentibacter sp.]HOT21584.1 universal stress protein [Sedimentibacter sp.]
MKKILVPVDGSAASQKAVAQAFDIGRKYNSDVVVFHVFIEHDIDMYNKFGVVIDPDMNKLKKRLKENESKMLDSIINQYDNTGINLKKKIVSGVAYEEILKEAKDGNYDLIVIGQRGYSKIKRFFVGSQTVRVISDATCPVLVVHE